MDVVILFKGKKSDFRLAVKMKRAEIERFDWFIERIQTRVAFEKNFMPENFLEINQYFALTSYCNTIGQSNNDFSILGFSLAGKRRVHGLIFLSIG